MNGGIRSPGISLGSENHGRLFTNSTTGRSLKKVIPGNLAAQYRLNVTPTRISDFNKIIRPKKHDMVQLVVDEVEASGVLKSPKNEEKEVREIKLLNLDDTDLSDEEDELEKYFINESHPKESMCQKLYNDACRALQITPMKLFYKGLETDEIRIVGITMRPNDIKACAIALCKDCEVEKFTFDGNDLRSAGAMYLGDVLSRNTYLVEAVITENNIGRQGVAAICSALKSNNYLRKLDLSGNSLTEEDAVHFKEMLDENHALRELYVRHNNFHETGGEIFAEGLAANDFLKVLDLSWNHLRLRGATALGRALQVNRHLEKLDISWNGFHLTGAATISYALTMNSTLLELNLSCNRLTDACAQCLIKGLEKNSTLKVLRLGQNQMYPDSAMAILECINQSLNSGIQLLDLGDQCVYDKFETLYRDMKTRRNPFEAIYGYVWDTQREGISQTDINEEEKDLIDEDPLMVLFEYARLQNFRLLDMFVILDKDKSGSLDKAEFKEGLELVQIPISERSLEFLMKKMDTDGDGEINFRELILGQNKYKAKLKEYMRGDIPLENTEIGRIDRKLRLVMSRRHLMKKKKKKTEGQNVLQTLVETKSHVDTEIPDDEIALLESSETASIITSISQVRKNINSMTNLMKILQTLKRMALTPSNDKHNTEDLDSDYFA